MTTGQPLSSIVLTLKVFSGDAKGKVSFMGGFTVSSGKRSVQIYLPYLPNPWHSLQKYSQTYSLKNIGNATAAGRLE